MARVVLKLGDCRKLLRGLETASIDSVVTDPPYEINLIGKTWDRSGIAYDVAMWREVLRVLKPGGHLLSFGATRTYHRMACAIEDAGFKIRDSIHWMYGQGVPKGLDISQQIDKQAGATREIVRSVNRGGLNAPTSSNNMLQLGLRNQYHITAPSTDAAKQWSGWNTALRPSHEPIVMARKPIEGSLTQNVLKHGTGAINVDGTKIGEASDEAVETTPSFGEMDIPIEATVDPRRWPANILLDEHTAAELDHHTGALAASSFFYVAKPTRDEKDRGCDDLPLVDIKMSLGTNKLGKENPVASAYGKAGACTSGGVRNTHPTAKPILLMQYLIRLVTPPGGTVLDPFMGSGTTGCAARMEQMSFVGFDLTPEFIEIAAARIAYWQAEAEDLFSEEAPEPIVVVRTAEEPAEPAAASTEPAAQPDEPPIRPAWKPIR